MVWTCREKTGRLCCKKRRQTTRGRERFRKTIRETIKKDLEINDLGRIMVMDRVMYWVCCDLNL